MKRFFRRIKYIKTNYEKIIKMFSDNGPLHIALSHCLLLIDSNAPFDWLVLVHQSGTRYCMLNIYGHLSLWLLEWTFSCRFHAANFDITVISHLNIKHLIYTFFLSSCMFQNSQCNFKKVFLHFELSLDTIVHNTKQQPSHWFANQLQDP